MTLGWKSKLRDYLDGFLGAFDFHPVSRRNLFVRDDADALRRDWEKVGEDLRKAMKDMDREIAARKSRF
jgi:hypothetical protein